MSTPRKRTTGFSAPKDTEEAAIEEFLDASAREMFETISREEEEAAKEEPVFVPQEIAPTPDPGPRFVEETLTPPPQAPAPSPTPQLQPPPKRHPRNVPKFSRYK